MSYPKNSGFLSNKLVFASIFFTAAFLIGCEGEVDTRGVASQLKDRKIRKITDSQVLSAAEAEAALLLQSVDSIWKAKLAKRKEHEISACNLDTVFESIRTNHNVVIERIGLNPIAEKAKGDSIQRQLLDAYLYNAEQKLPMRSNTQRLATKRIIYTAPIVINSDECLKCHGDIKVVPGNTATSIGKTYSTSKPQNFKKDSIIGMWSITFLKKDLVRKIK